VLGFGLLDFGCNDLQVIFEHRAITTGVIMDFKSPLIARLGEKSPGMFLVVYLVIIHR
jgi:hypothetical protein